MQVIAGADISRRRRGPFLSSVEILVLAGMVAVLLWFLFPGRNYDNPYLLARPDHLSIAYLSMLLRAHPEDAQARLLLAQQQMALGELDDARQSLELVMALNKPEFTAKAEVVALKLDRSRLVAMVPRAAGAGRAGGAGAQGGLQDADPRTERPDDLADLADFMLSEGDPATAAKTYLRLSVLDRKNYIGWLEKAARWTRGIGRPRRGGAPVRPGGAGHDGQRPGRQPGARGAAGAAGGQRGQAGDGPGARRSSSAFPTTWSCWSRPSTWRWRRGICRRPGSGPNGGCSWPAAASRRCATRWTS